MTSAPPKGSSAVPWPPWAPPTVSLLLIVHLFFVFVALAANVAPSRLQQRLLAKFSFYVQLLNLDLNFTPLYLTHASLRDVDHRLELLPEGGNPDAVGEWRVLPDVGLRGSDRYQRYQRLAGVVSYFSAQDEVTAALARAVGAHFIAQRGIRPQRFRCRRHLLQDWNVIRAGTAAQRDPNDASYFRVAYDANFVISRDGAVSVVKLAEADELASPITNAKDGGRDASNP